MARLRRAIAIDLGTSLVLVYVLGKGIVLEEPSVIAIDVLTDEILAVGSEAKKLIGRAPGNIKAIMPIKDGVISDFKATERMLKYFLDKAVKKALLKPDLLICVPSRSTQVEKRAVLQASDNAGSHRTYLIEEPLAAALGAGCDITDVGGSLVIDIGGGTSDIAVISMGQVVASKSVDSAGTSFDRKIKDYIRQRYGILIGDTKSEEIKIEAGLADLEQSLEVTGRAITSGLPQKIYLPVAEIYDCIRSEIDLIVGGAFSGKDPTKVDRSAAYMARYAAKNMVAAGLAKKLEIGLSYAIGVARPLSIYVDSFGTGKYDDEKLLEIVKENFDFRPQAIIDKLDLKRPIYKKTAAFGHFGRNDKDFTWESLDKVNDLKKY